ncbi:MAG: hypothetical protein KDK07_22635 [Bauldia sp.]|nr:hypothetical protein [Bauldia sp.]
MAVNFTRVGPEIQVNTAVEYDEFNPDTAALTDGRFAVANTRALSDTDWDVNLQFLNADGTLSGQRLLIDNNLGVQTDPAVALVDGGGAVVIWTDKDGKDAAGADVTDDIQLRVVSKSGVMGTTLTVAASFAPTVAYSRPDLATLADGRIVAVFESNISGALNIDLRVVNAAGTSVTAPLSAASVTDNAESRTPSIAASGNKALIAYETTSAGDIHVKLFNGSTSTLNLPSSSDGILVASSGDLVSPDVAALTDGRYIVVWENNTNHHVEGRFVDAAGNPTGSVFTIANNSGENEDPQVAALADGGFIVTWDTNGDVIAPDNHGSSWAVLARRFDSSGAAAGDLFLVNTGDPDTNQFFPTVAVNSGTGQAFIAWTDYHAFSGAGQDNSPPGVRGHAFKATTDVVNGTPGGDTITTYSLSETINGLAGNDTIHARGGNDKVDGGPGSDLIFGEAGGDSMAGGEGADTVDGGDGNDLLNGGPGNDSLTGGPGADRFAFTTALKPKGTNVDTIADFSAPSDSILLDNAIFKKLKKTGPLAAKFFEVGKKAHSKKDFIVYNDKTGDLHYDKNGSKKGGALLFAHLEGSPDDVSAADFFVI